MSTLTNIEFHYYVNFPGRGEFITLLLDDAGLDYKIYAYTPEEWAQKKPELLAQDIPIPTIPYLVINGEYIGKTAPILRYISTKVGKYLGESDRENQFLDSLSDIIMEWFQFWAVAHYSPAANEETERIYNMEGGRGPRYHNAFDKVLAKSDGPYVLGEKISYVDFMIYKACIEDGIHKNVNSTNYPNLKKFFEAMDSRPAMKKHFGKE